MVREVPNYAEQYLTEHPELNPPEPNTHVAPDAPVPGAEQSSAEDCHPEAAQAFAKRRPANEGSTIPRARTLIASRSIRRVRLWATTRRTLMAGAASSRQVVQVSRAEE
jgi:hypothetical protein